MNARIVSLASLAVVSAVALAGCSSQSSSDEMSPAMSPSAMMESSEAMAPSDGMSPSDAMSMEHSEEAMMAPASYVTYEDYEAAKADYADSKVVLFFNATWCPACKAITESLTADPAQIPAKTTVVSVDYDMHTDLRERYGVTMQHTFVEIDSAGEKVRQWTSTSPEDLLKELQS